MLESTFIHLPGIGLETERRFWAQGVRTWADLKQNVSDLFGPKRAEQIAAALMESQAAHAAREFAFFQSRLKTSEMWRLVPALFSSGLGERIAYLDIETTGLGFPPECQSTTIAVLFKGRLHVEHERPRKRLLLQQLEDEAAMLVTFNGSTFDLPFLRREFALRLVQPHVDLRYWLGRLGFKGGLKAVQKAFPEVHQRTSLDIDGFDAVRLWTLHQKGVPNALETLSTYNAEDTIVLEQLVYSCLNLEAESRADLGLTTYPMPKPPRIATTVCPHVYRMLRG